MAYVTAVTGLPTTPPCGVRSAHDGSATTGLMCIGVLGGKWEPPAVLPMRMPYLGNARRRRGRPGKRKSSYAYQDDCPSIRDLQPRAGEEPGWSFPPGEPDQPSAWWQLSELAAGTPHPLAQSGPRPVRPEADVSERGVRHLRRQRGQALPA